MSTNTTAAEIAASIDTSTTGGHNLRALLLRLLDGEDWQPWKRSGPDDACCVARRRAVEMGLVCSIESQLHPIGAEVAELLRPLPWRVRAETRRGLFGFRVEHDDHPSCKSHDEEAAILVSRLLTEHYLREAKQYRTEPA